jgi:putative transposase
MFSSTHLAQLLTAFPSDLFQREVINCGTDRYAKVCRSRDLLMTLLLGHLQQANSLRSLTMMSQAIDEHRYHLNARSLPRSTLSDALNKRSVVPFQKAAEHLLKCIGGQQRRGLGRMVSLIDSTSITLRGPGFDEWTMSNKTRITQGLKVHTGFDPVQLAPTYINITPVNINDMTDALNMPVQPGMTYVFDKGYCDYGWWDRLHGAGAFFVTRLKSNANVNWHWRYRRTMQRREGV